MRRRGSAAVGGLAGGAAAAATTRKRFEGLGEGRSKPIYIRPRCTDTAVLLAFYNPARFRRSLKNILYLTAVFRAYGIPYYVAECVFGTYKPQIPDAALVIRSNSYLFYKELLLNKLEAVVPPQYTKLVMLDGDILFDTPDWLDHISAALETHDIVQPFSQACWLTPDNTIISSKKYGYGYVIGRGMRIRVEDIHAYHPGFAWAFRRDVFRKMGGYYDRAIVGGGDMMFVCTFLPSSFLERHRSEMSIPPMITEGFAAYKERARALEPRVGYIDMKALHLFHGLSGNRQYRTRYKALLERLTTARWDDVITSTTPLYEFKDPALRAVLLEYFKGRNEDIPLEEAMGATRGAPARNETRKQPARPRLSAATVASPVKINAFELPAPPSAWGLAPVELNLGDTPSTASHAP